MSADPGSLILFIPRPLELLAAVRRLGNCVPDVSIDPVLGGLIAQLRSASTRRFHFHRVKGG